MKKVYIAFGLVLLIHLHAWAGEPIRVTENKDSGGTTWILFNNNEEMEKYINQIKSISCNSTIEEVSKAIGDPCYKTNNYYFYNIANVISGNLEDAKSNIQKRYLGQSDYIKYRTIDVRITEQENKKIGTLQISEEGKSCYTKRFGIESEIQDLITVVKSLNIGEATTDDLISKLKVPYKCVKSLDGDTYIFGGEVEEKWILFYVAFDSLGKLKSIKVNKGMDVIYNKSSSDTPLAPTVNNATSLQIPKSSTPPTATDVGQIYFNSNDSHFYGWNGTEWRQLDNSKN